MTLIYAVVFGLLAFLISEYDPVWGWVVFGIAFLIIGGLHFYAKDK